VLDTKGGGSCGPAFDAWWGCVAFECDSCSTNTTASQCIKQQSLTGGSCASEYAAYSPACATDNLDGGYLQTTCSPSDVSGVPDDDFTFIIGLFCGSGTGGADGGDGG
jgi:hypothetical protein